MKKMNDNITLLIVILALFGLTYMLDEPQSNAEHVHHFDAVDFDGSQGEWVCGSSGELESDQNYDVFTVFESSAVFELPESSTITNSIAIGRNAGFGAFDNVVMIGKNAGTGANDFNESFDDYIEVRLDTLRHWEYKLDSLRNAMNNE